MTLKKKIWIQMALGVICFIMAFSLGAIRKIEPFHTYLYLFCWIPFIWTLDRVVLARQGQSWIGQPRKFVWYLGFSTTLWLFFEVLNFRLQNWYYIGLPESPFIRWPGYALSYATVVPGILLLAECLKGHFRDEAAESAPAAPKRIGGKWSLPLGGAMLVLPMLWPRYFFPLVWGAPFFLLEPWVQKKGGHSLMRDWNIRNRSTTYALLLSGLLCGLFWEGCNFGAGAKWIYEIPFVGFIKIFEMPMLGFLGFPAFALTLFVMTEAARLLWKESSPQRKKVLVTAAVVFWLAVFAGIDYWTRVF